MHKPKRSFRKVLAAGLAITTALWSFSFLLVVPVAAAVEVHPAGTLVLSGGTVWKISDDGSSRVGFDTPERFWSSRYSFDQVVPANSADLALPDGGLAPWGSGVLFNDNGTVFMVAGGVKRGFSSSAAFTGQGYSFANTVAGDVSSVPAGANIDSATQAHPEGTFVLDNGTVWYITATGRMGLSQPGVLFSHGGSFDTLVPANAADLALANEGLKNFRTGTLVNDNDTIWAVQGNIKRGFPSASCYTGFGFNFSSPIAGDVSSYSQGDDFCPGGTTDPTPTPSTGTLSVSLAGDTPAAGTAIKSAARVPFTKVNLTATGGDVVVDSWVVERAGISQDSSFSNLHIVDLSTNSTLNETGKTLSSEHKANFTEDLTIPNGTTKSVMLAGDIAASPGSGETPKLALNSVVLKGGTVVGAFPIVGNAQTINTSITIGTATVQRGAYTNATSTSLEVGKTDYTFFSFQVQAGSGEDTSFKQVKVYQSGSASLSADLANVKLYRDGTFLADGVITGNYVNFNLPTAELIKKGQTSQYRVQADVIDGTARTIILGIRNTTDMLITGQTYGANLTPTYSGSGSSGGTPVLADNSFTISVGTFRIGRSNTVAADNIAVGNDQTLGAFEFEVKGEAMIVSALTLTVASSTSGTIIEDAALSFRLVDSNGTTVAGPTDITNHALTVAWSDTFTVPVGTNAYKVVANVATNGGWANNDTITVKINTPGSATTAKGETTGQTVTVTPSSEITASTQTVKAVNLTVTKDSTPTNKSVIVSSVSQLIGSWNLDATDSGEDVRITSIAVRASTTGKLNNLTLKAAGSALSPVNNAPTAGANVTSTFALSSPLVVTKGTSTQLQLFADIGSNGNAGEVDAWGLTDTTSATNASVVAYGVTTGNRANVSLTASDGALMTIAAAGTLTVDLHADAPASRQVTHGSTGVVLSEVRLKATNEDVRITRMRLFVADGGLTSTAAGTFAQIEKAFLKLDGAIVGSTTGYSLGAAKTTLNFGTNDITIPEGTTGKKLSLIGDLVDIGTNQPGTANADIAVGLGGADGFTATGVSNNSATITYNDSTGTAIVLHKAIPSVVIEEPAGSLSATATLHRAKISAVGNTIGIFRMSYSTTSSTGLILTNLFTRLAACSGGCGGIGTGSQLATTDADGDYLVDGTETWDLQVSSALAHGKRYLAISAGSTATIDLIGTVTGFTSNSDSVSTSLLGDTASTTNDTGGDPTAAFTGTTNKQGNFVWSDLNGDDTQAASSLTNGQWYNGYLVSGLGATATTSAITKSD